MTEYFFTADITLRGVTLIVEAKNKDEAKRKAEGGQWNNWDIKGGELVDWKITSKPEENK